MVRAQYPPRATHHRRRCARARRRPRQRLAARHGAVQAMRSRMWPLGIVVALMLPLLGMGWSPANAQDSRGFSEIAGCISGADNLLVAVVVDESASLRQTDPGALRVAGIQSAM